MRDSPIELRKRLIIKMAVAFCLAAILSGCVSLVRPNFSSVIAELRPGEYSLDPEHVYVHFRVEHLGLSTIVGRFNQADATLDFDPANIEKLQLEGLIDVASIDVNNATLEDQLQSSAWFDTESFPQASFKSTSVVMGDGQAFVISGDFTLKGVTRPLSLNAVFKGGADNLLTGKYTLGFAATGSILRSDFGIDSFLGLVADEVFVEINAEFQQGE